MFYKIRIHNLKKSHRFEELIKVFLPPENFIILLDERDENGSRNIDFRQEENYTNEFLKNKDIVNLEFYFDDNNSLSRQIYKELSKLTSKTSPWGTLTGIRPVRLFRNYFNNFCRDERDFKKVLGITGEELRRDYLISDEKLDLLKKIFSFQENNFPVVDKKSIGLYIGIPFCPTRCHYCSFTSNIPRERDIEAYLKALCEEIEFCGQNLKESRLYIESVYIGGGTPSTLQAEEIDFFIKKIRRSFDLSKCMEFTFEAGRADTITIEKLRVLKENGVDRISINPQSMKDETLHTIGRNHSEKDVVDAFRLAKEVGFSNINCDLIAGLQGENIEDFKRSIQKVIDLNPESITVHTLAMKKTSTLTQSKIYSQYEDIDTQKMLDYAYEAMEDKKYFPYYMYRQKNILGMGENVGFAKDKKASLYNFRIMEENQSILALGAGGISKVYFPEEDRLERIANVSDLKTYVDRIDHMKKRKLDKFFKEIDNVN